MSVKNQPLVANMAQWLLREHGPLLDAATTAKVLGFRSLDALRQARRDCRLPIPMFKIPGRRGWFAATLTVATWLEGRTQPTSTQAGAIKEDQP